MKLRLSRAGAAALGRSLFDWVEALAEEHITAGCAGPPRKSEKP